MSFLTYDLVLLFLFLLFISLFLYKNRRGLKREGLLILYRTKWGINFINKVGNKYKKTLKLLSFFSVIVGYFLMAGSIYLVYNVVKEYILNPSLVQAIKVPPITPLIPYLPQVLKLNFLPPFYFTYWILIIAIIAVSHEFSHGIFAAYDKIKIKKTGFGFFPFFLPVFLAAFVELDEKNMSKKTKFSQLTVLSAGTFSNVIIGILFFLIFILFFSLAFSPAGIIYDTYALNNISIHDIVSVNGVHLTNFSYDQALSLMKNDSLNELATKNQTYLTTFNSLTSQKGQEALYVYYDAPAIKNNLSSIITEINGVKIASTNNLAQELSKYKPGDEITIKTLNDSSSQEIKIILEENPGKKGVAWLGIGFYTQQSSGLIGKVVEKLSSFKKPNVYYAPKINGVSIFIYNLLWWIVIISFSVALINMLPVGIFDGGRFFYLSVLAVTKNEKIAKNAFKVSTYLLLLAILALMIIWILGISG